MDQEREQAFNDAFEKTLSFVAGRREREPDFTIETLDGLLSAEYHIQDNSWAGKGLLQEAAQNGVIAAYEQALVNWKKELGKL